MFENHDIVLLTETWTNPLWNIEVAGFEHYVLHRLYKKKGTRRDSGGLAIYVRNNLSKGIKLIKTGQDDII